MNENFLIALKACRVLGAYLKLKLCCIVGMKRAFTFSKYFIGGDIMETEKVMNERTSVWNKYLIWALTIQTITALAYYGYVPLIPLIEKEFTLSNGQIGWMSSAVFLGSSLIAIPSGILTDKIGSRTSLFLFNLLIVFITLAFYISNSFYTILCLLFLLGIGYGGITPGTNKSIMGKFHHNNRATAMGIKQMGVTIGSTIGTFMLPILANQFGWRTSLLSISFFLIPICIYHFKILESDEGSKNKVDFLVNIKEILQNKKFLKIIGVIIFFIWVQLSVMTYLVLYLHETVHKPISLALFCLATLQIGGVIGRGCWGTISDRFYNRNRGGILAIIGLLSGLLICGLGFMADKLPFIIILLASLLLGITTQGWNGLFVVMISEVVNSNQIGLASGVGLAVVYSGAIFGTPLSGWIIDSSGNYETMWYTCGLVIFSVGIITKFLKIDYGKEM